MIQDVYALRITLSLSPLLLGHENVGVRVIARGNSRGGSGGSGSRSRGVGNDTFRVDGQLGDGGREGSDVFEDVFGVQEFRINVFGCEEVLANDENLGRDVTTC